MQSILLIKTSSLGDVVHNLPVASDIRARFPDARIDWVVEEGYAAIARLHPAVRRVIPVALRRWRHALLSRATWREIAAFRRVLREQDYGLVLDTQGLLKSAIITRMASGRRAGFAAETAREPLAARFYDTTFAIPKNLHAVERNRWLAAAALEYAPDLPLDYGIRAEPIDAPWLPAKPYCILLTATSRADKQWPAADWLRLAAWLNARDVACVLPSGSATERESAQRLAAQMAAALAAPFLGIDAMTGLIAGAHVVVGVDTGLSHLAAALGKPTVALFCGSNPELTGVHAGDRAVNLGTRARSPSAEEAIAAVANLLDVSTAPASFAQTEAGRVERRYAAQ